MTTLLPTESTIQTNESENKENCNVHQLFINDIENCSLQHSLQVINDPRRPLDGRYQLEQREKCWIPA